MENNLTKISIKLDALNSNKPKKESSEEPLENFNCDSIRAKQEPWQSALSQAVTNPKQLLQALQLDSSLLNEQAQDASKLFRTFVTQSFLKRIKKGEPNDPLLKQVLPDALELINPDNFINDPLGEQEANPNPGLLHKYQGRALLITNAHCAINCRFCFRRNFPYSGNHLSSKSEAEIIDYLTNNKSISEVILSGGDPLLLTDQRLQGILTKLENIVHVKRVRIHSRVPIVLPERITGSLCNILESSPLSIVMVIHCNHPQEINEEVSNKLKALKQVCTRLLNQSVLLKGVNDEATTLINLQKLLFENEVESYYLHLLDKVSGSAHFDTPLDEALKIYREMQVQLPGYMLPRLAREEAGKPNKTLICQDNQPIC
jgi:EF-P beta-lysylation protein EpmB